MIDEKNQKKPEIKGSQTYISKYLSLRLIIKSAYTKEVDGRVVMASGESIQFADGVYITSDKKEIEFLENHKNFGSVFVKVDKKNVEKVKSEQYKDLETKEAELKTKEEELEKKEKALEEGSGVPKEKGNKSKKEKAQF